MTLIAWIPLRMISICKDIPEKSCHNFDIVTTNNSKPTARPRPGSNFNTLSYDFPRLRKANIINFITVVVC